MRDRGACMNNKPFIHLFRTPLGFYFYDVNTNEIVEVDHQIYRYLEVGENESSEQIQSRISSLKMRGYLKEKHVEQTKHPVTELLPFYAESKIGQLILQVTQNCNLRCNYCVYSGGYDTRMHNNKRMSFEMAKKSIDFLKLHSRNQERVIIGFYGGEPLLEFSLIKKCVEYAESTLKGKKIEYSTTTNATLLNDEVIRYFILKNFLITVSLDGTKDIQDSSRRFGDGSRGTFELVMNNLKKIKEIDNDYFERNVRINTVLVPERGYASIDSFFSGNEIFKNLSISSATVSDSYSKTKTQVSEQFLEEQQYELFKTFLAELGYLPKEKESLLMRSYIEHLCDTRSDLERAVREEVPSEWHRGGPCLPGIMRLFVTVDGTFLPCEKVCEISDYAQIGNIEDGFDIKKMDALLNIERITEDECKECWAYSECSSCIRFCNGEKEEMRRMLLGKCKDIRNGIESMCKDYTVLQKYGFSQPLSLD